MLKEWTIKKHIIISVAVSMIIGVVLYIIIQPESFETVAIASENQSSNLPPVIKIGTNYIIIVSVLMLILNIMLYKIVQNILEKNIIRE